jgi:mono/diheme cytochrome c family protein
MSFSGSRWLYRSGLALLALAVLAAVVLGLGLYLAERKMQRKVEIPEIALQLANPAGPAEAAQVERGRYLYASRGCVDCHGANGGGRRFIDDPMGLRVAGPHISPGPGSVTAAYRPADWTRAIRHGVDPRGRPLMIMPSEDYNRFTDADLGALVSYLRSMPPATGGAALLELPPLVRALYGFGVIQDAAAKIDHQLPPAQAVPEGVSVAHGAYVANMCLGCHGAQLTGGKIPGAPPDWPAASRLAPGGESVMRR